MNSKREEATPKILSGYPIYRLCYVECGTAYFTTHDLDKQWGDDWNDAPYEHNAGYPYKPNPDRPEEDWDIEVIPFKSKMKTPGECGLLNSSYSVQDINREKVPWLTMYDGTQMIPESPRIWAGMSAEWFCDIIEKNGGSVYLERTYKT